MFLYLRLQIKVLPNIFNIHVVNVGNYISVSRPRSCATSAGLVHKATISITMTSSVLNWLREKYFVVSSLQ
jgi:hypothetical protein